MKRLKQFCFTLHVIMIVLYFLEVPSLLKAQERYYNISICKRCNDAQESGGWNRCVGCGKNTDLTKIKAKICWDCWAKRGGLWERGCWLCNENTLGGGYARLCSECAKKDECIECGKKLGSGDTYAETDNRKIVAKYTVQITIPGKKEEFMSYFNKGSDALKNMNYEEALDYFMKCNEIIPHGMDCNIGIALRELKREEEALTYFDSAIKEEPNWGDPYGEKGITMAYLGRWNDSGPLFKKAIDLNYDSPTVYWMYGIYIAEILKKPSDAIPFYEKVIAKNPTKSFKLYNDIGDIYFSQEKYDDAEKAFKMVLEYDPKDFNALAFTGEVKFKKQNFEEALKYYLPAHEVKPDNLELNYHMGICYGYLNQLEKAESHYKHTLSINPDLADVRLELANLYRYQKRFTEAIIIYKKWISDDAVTYPAYLDLGNCQYAAGLYKESIENCRKFISEDKNNNPEPYVTIALSEVNLNQYSNAIANCEKALELNVNGLAEVFYNLACAYSKMNKIDKSLDMLEKSLKTGQVNISYLESDADLTNVRETKAYKDLLTRYGAVNQIQQQKPEF